MNLQILIMAVVSKTDMSKDAKIYVHFSSECKGLTFSAQDPRWDIFISAFFPVNYSDSDSDSGLGFLYIAK